MRGTGLHFTPQGTPLLCLPWIAYAENRASWLKSSKWLKDHCVSTTKRIIFFMSRPLADKVDTKESNVDSGD